MPIIITARVAAPPIAAYFIANFWFCHTKRETHTSHPHTNAMTSIIPKMIVHPFTLPYWLGLISGSPARIRTWVSRSRVSNDGPLHYGAEQGSVWFGA